MTNDKRQSLIEFGKRILTIKRNADTKSGQLMAIGVSTLEAKSRKLFTCTGCSHSLLDEHPSSCDCEIQDAHYVQSTVIQVTE